MPCFCIICSKKQASFGYSNEKAQYCGDCKKEGMIDVRSRKCIQCKQKKPNFGQPTEKKVQYCGDCKKEGMIDLKSRKCIICNTKQPNFGLPTDEKAQYCGDCKTEGMMNLRKKRRKIDIWELL